MDAKSTVIKLLREPAARQLTLVSDDTLARATTLGGVLRSGAHELRDLGIPGSSALCDQSG